MTKRNKGKDTPLTEKLAIIGQATATMHPDAARSVVRIVLYEQGE